jgi:hypothetical protein
LITGNAESTPMTTPPSSAGCVFAAAISVLTVVTS